MTPAPYPRVGAMEISIPPTGPTGRRAPHGCASDTTCTMKSGCLHHVCHLHSAVPCGALPPRARPHPSPGTAHRTDAVTHTCHVSSSTPCRTVSSSPGSSRISNTSGSSQPHVPHNTCHPSVPGIPDTRMGASASSASASSPSRHRKSPAGFSPVGLPRFSFSPL